MTNRSTRTVRLETIGQIRPFIYRRNNGNRRKYTDRQLLARSCNFSLSHVTNMLNGVRTATPEFVEKARTIAQKNLGKSLA